MRPWGYRSGGKGGGEGVRKKTTSLWPEFFLLSSSCGRRAKQKSGENVVTLASPRLRVARVSLWHWRLCVEGNGNGIFGANPPAESVKKKMPPLPPSLSGQTREKLSGKIQGHMCEPSLRLQSDHTTPVISSLSVRVRLTYVGRQRVDKLL